MKTSNIFKLVYLISCLITIFVLSGMSDDIYTAADKFTDEDCVDPNSPISIQMYEYLEKYSDEYNIPKYVVYNIAYKETTYRGPFDWKYNPHRTSCVGALGPMQIMPSTSDWINKKEYSNDKIMKDLRLNIETSMKLLRKLYNQYSDWEIVCGWYNTGKPIVNEYGRYCGTNKDYKSKWLSLK